MSTRISYLDEMLPAFTGCTKLSPGCEHCYAARWAATRLKHHPAYAGLAHKTADGYDWCETPRFHPELLEKLRHWRKGRRIGMVFTADWMHEAITYDQRCDMLDAMYDAPQHQYFLLTKRAADQRAFFECWTEDGKIPDNWWLGVTICNQPEADRDIPQLLRTASMGGRAWVSIEPMLGAVDFGEEPVGMGFGSWFSHDSRFGVNWVVLGGESGPGARPMQPEWALDVWRQCKAAGVPFYFKQWGSAGQDRMIHADEMPELQAMIHTREIPAVAR